MIRNFVISAIALIFLVAPAAQAAGGKAVFAGKYTGNGSIQNATGKTVYFIPIRFTVRKDGTVTGTAYRTAPAKLLKVKGKISKYRSQAGIYTGIASGRFSDGTTWKAEITAAPGTFTKMISGSCRKKTFRGQFGLVLN